MESAYKKLYKAWASIFNKDIATIRKIACNLDLNPAFFFDSDGKALDKNQVMQILQSPSTTKDFEQFRSIPWFSQTSKSNLVSMAKTVAQFNAYVYALNEDNNDKIYRLIDPVKDKIRHDIFEDIETERETEDKLLQANFERMIGSSTAIINLLTYKTAILLFELVGRCACTMSGKIDLFITMKRTATKIENAVQKATEATVTEAKVTEDTEQLLNKLRKVNRIAYLIAKDYDNADDVEHLRSDLLAGWQSSRVSSRYLMLKHFVNEQTGQPFKKINDIINAIISKKTPTWGRYIGSAIELAKRFTFTHRRSLSSKNQKKLLELKSKRPVKVKPAKTAKTAEGKRAKTRKKNDVTPTDMLSTMAGLGVYVGARQLLKSRQKK